MNQLTAWSLPVKTTRVRIQTSVTLIEQSSIVNSFIKNEKEPGNGPFKKDCKRE